MFEAVRTDDTLVVKNSTFLAIPDMLKIIIDQRNNLLFSLQQTSRTRRYFEARLFLGK